MRSMTNGPGAPWIYVVLSLLPFDVSLRAELLRAVHVSGKGWRVYFGEEPGVRAALLSDSAKPAAVVGRLEDAETARLLSQTGVPCVRIGRGLGHLFRRARFVRSGFDPAATGRVVAAHFLAQHRFASYLFLSARHAPNDARLWSESVRRAFEGALAAHGLPHVQYSPDPAKAGPDYARQVFELLRGATKPLAVLCATDAIANNVEQFCGGEGMRVPQDIALVGLGNDRICEHAPIPISSVDFPVAALADRIVRILSSLVAGESVPFVLQRLLPTRHVVERESSSASPVIDHFVTQATRYIGAHQEDAISVSDVVRTCGTSRRFLERRFKVLTGFTLLEYIHVRRVAYVGMLLEKTDLPVREIARRAHFSGSAALGVLFKGHTGCTMIEYRQRTRRGEAAPTPLPRFDDTKGNPSTKTSR